MLAWELAMGLESALGSVAALDLASLESLVFELVD